MNFYQSLGCGLSSTNWEDSSMPTSSINARVSRRDLISKLIMQSLLGCSGFYKICKKMFKMFILAVSYEIAVTECCQKKFNIYL